MWFSFSSVFRPFFVSPRERAPQPAEVRALEAAAIRSGDWVHLHHEIGLGEGGVCLRRDPCASKPSLAPLRTAHGRRRSGAAEEEEEEQQQKENGATPVSILTGRLSPGLAARPISPHGLKCAHLCPVRAWSWFVCLVAASCLSV